MPDLRASLAQAQERHALVERLLADAVASAEQARALLALSSTWPRKRKEVEAELSTAEMDLPMLREELAVTCAKIRDLEVQMGAEMAAAIERELARKAASQECQDDSDEAAAIAEA